MTKDERNKQDRAQMLKFVQQMRSVKASQVSLSLKIIKEANTSAKAVSLNY